MKFMIHQVCNIYNHINTKQNLFSNKTYIKYIKNH